MAFIILDVETTGHENGDIIQIAFYTPSGECFVSNVAPNRLILPSATVVHGVTNEEAKTFPNRDVVNHNLREYIKKNFVPGLVVIGHNISFDAEALKNNFRIIPSKLIDTLRMARKLIKKEDSGNYKLDTIFYYLFPDKLHELKRVRANHDALEDCKLTYDVFRGLNEIAIKQGLYPDDGNIDTVLNWVNSPMLVELWPFGKHKGQPLNCDIKYAEWYLTKAENKDVDIVWSLTKLLRK